MCFARCEIRSAGGHVVVVLTADEAHIDPAASGRTRKSRSARLRASSGVVTVVIFLPHVSSSGSSGSWSEGMSSTSSR